MSLADSPGASLRESVTPCKGQWDQKRDWVSTDEGKYGCRKARGNAATRVF